MRMKEISIQKTVQTATEVHYHVVFHSKEAEEMAFNRANFMKGSKQYPSVPEWAKDIMVKPPMERNESELRKIHALLRGLKSFDKFTHNIQIAMCQSCTYESIESRRVVLRKGHVGLCFYFIYSGSVFVNTEEIHPTTKAVFTKTEAILTKGDSFGELALLRDIKRTATISTRGTCEFFVIDKDVFSSLCPKIFDQELETKVNFVGNVSVFRKHWSMDVIKNLCNEAQIQEFKTNRVITSDNMQDDWIYMCMEGRCRILKFLSLGAESTQSGDVEKQDSSVIDLALLITEQTIGKKVVRRQEDFRVECKSREEQKKNMLSAMHLEYAEKPYAKGELELAELDESGNAIIKESSTPDPSSQADEFLPNMSLNAFIKLQNKKTENQDSVYLDVGVLKPSQVYNFDAILNATVANKGLILVSAGAKVLRLKKQLLFKLATPEALEFSRTLAAQFSYPSQKVLHHSYVQHTKWEYYKQSVVRDTMAAAGKVSSLTDDRKKIRLNQRRRDNRLKSTLENDHKEQLRLLRLLDARSKSAPSPAMQKIFARYEEMAAQEDNRCDSSSHWQETDNAFLVPIRGGGSARRKNKLLEEELLMHQIKSPTQLNVVVDVVSEVRFN
uniref:Cyclic nucleotide-binding domain-containing protein 2-like n=1 Tax=Saccoglossus kowalevskii TaxID=10224 RepID=A0ABM0MAT7_SACKO|nr:PREDICTED: cyclic nucleotide-binding domain-containing protein 2-like [Saccoglossus kowalevskii]